ncbi:MAG: uroporphyrinogen decarboxylase family protein [Candidatus Neomarinimicrobiota bacterium]
MVPSIEQFKLTLKRGRGDHLPLAELGIHPTIKEKFLGRPIISLSDEVAFWQSAGYDYIKLQPRADFKIPGHIIDESIAGSRSWAPEGLGRINSWAEFDRFDFITAADIDYTVFEQVRPLLSQGMGVIGQYGDIFTMTWGLMGFEGFSYALFENPQLVAAIFEKIGQPVLSMFEYLAQCEAVDILWFSDDIAYTSGLLVSPAILREYFFPWLKKIGDLARRYNKPLIYHSDGVLWDVMEDIIDCGVDALHPIEPRAMDIAEVKRRYGDRLCLIGNLDVGDLALAEPDQIRQTVREIYQQVGYNGGYCVGSGNSIPDYVKFENYLAMLDTVKELNA